MNRREDVTPGSLVHSTGVGEDGEPAQPGHKPLLWGPEARYLLWIYGGPVNMEFTSLPLFGVGGATGEEREQLIGYEFL